MIIFLLTRGAGTAICLNVAPETLPPLTDDPAELKALILQLWVSLHDKNQDIQKLQHQLEQLKKKLYGSKSERWMPEPGLFAELLKLAPPPPEEESPPPPLKPAAASPKRNGHGRSPIPQNLQRHRIEHELKPEECKCKECGGELKKFGEEVTEQLDFVPAVAFVRQHVRFKYACPACQGNVVIAPMPAQPIDKGLPGPGLLAQVLISKYCDHLPLYRQEGIFRRHGLEINRSTMGGWVAQLAELLKLLVDLMKKDLLESKVTHTDDTPTPVQDGSKKQTRKARLWVYIGDQDHPQIVYDYTPNRTRDGPEWFLKTYKGYLQADAYPGYDRIYARGKTDPERRVIEVGCWAHARRGFFEAQTTDELRALMAMATIKRLYDVEREAASLNSDERRALRQEKAKPILDQFKAWLEKELPSVLPKGPMGMAIQYTLNQWEALNRYLEDGDLAIDNNAAERALRPIALGRKNWLFAGSDKGGERAAIVYSLIETCKRHGVEPYAYLRDVLDRIPSHPINTLRELLPQNWKPRPQPGPTPTATPHATEK